MDNSIYEVERAEYKTFIGQLNTENTHVEESWVGDVRSTKIYGDKSGKHLCTRLEDTEREEEHYFIFSYPEDEEYRDPTPVMTVNLDTKEEVQAFFNALSELQKETQNNDRNI